MRGIIFFLIASFFFLPIVQAEELETVIIEVEGDAEVHADYIKKYHPFIEVVATYSTLFNGIALQGKPQQLERLHTAEFITGIHDVQTYKAEPVRSSGQPQTQQAGEVPAHAHTGKNIKVGVIDTGIDYTHPDLKDNFAGGYDLFDLDEDPMETMPGEGMPTSHGTHVAGIIAANGKLQGIAPDASLYAYRALGPGGFGSTVHVLAALEQAVKDEMDVINLSLGNEVNGPDYPTSLAVDKAVELGIPVIIANGNSGPAPWTVGSPATAKNALAVGAVQAPTEMPYLYHAQEKQEISLTAMQGAPAWELAKDYKLINADENRTDLNGKIALFKRSEITFRDLALKAQENGAAAVLIYNNEPGELHGGLDNEDGAVKIPVAGITQEDGEWLTEYTGTYIDTVYESLDTTIAPFSSRGPATVNWQIKPNVAAPGAAINSTVPGGYEHLSGTSMAAPYVAGAVALLKEAHPDWSVDKIYHALETTATPLQTETGEFQAPSIQGHGVIQPHQAIEAPTIISNGTLEAGKITDRREEKQFTIQLENRTSETQQFTFDVPKRKQGMEWKLPLSFKIEPHATEEIKVALKVTSPKLLEGIQEDFLTLKEQTENKTYHLPYLFVNQSADQPKIAGIEFSLKPFSDDIYSYTLYTTEELQLVSIDLYDPDTLTYRGNLLELKEPSVGMNEGEIPSYKLAPGNYLGIITAINNDKEIETTEIPLHIE
ncbi:S8 family serine peptidase [Oceanobacillus alkalisoli]|uniref:S8 family serine peptidase n=1 Tax=Oceanobacillus alkalisoli TaxID=2925113 RepID=UPI001F11A921|nr:S8 family serine peptidase [Oceanobacillus alkalisoli]MCF3942737.1 S8 family serine peptidase [Oceanobacillus alkalisoli]